VDYPSRTNIRRRGIAKSEGEILYQLMAAFAPLSAHVVLGLVGVPV